MSDLSKARRSIDDMDRVSACRIGWALIELRPFLDSWLSSARQPSVADAALSQHDLFLASVRNDGSAFAGNDNGICAAFCTV